MVGLVLATGGTKDPFSPGAGSATITWTSVAGSNAPQPFGGTINGVPVSGVTTMDPSAFEGAVTGPGANPGGNSLSRVHILDIKGTFDGEHFALGLSLQYRGSLLSPTQPPAFLQIEVLGAYGNRPVRASLVPPASSLSDPGSVNASTPILFHGTIGTLKVSGKLMKPTKVGAENSATATFAVSN